MAHWAELWLITLMNGLLSGVTLISAKLQLTRVGPLKILLIEDHALVRCGIRMQLRDFDDRLDLSETGSCAEALLLRGTEFNLILLDMGLPGLHGIESIPVIREAFPASAVVVVSGEENPGLIRKAIDAGASGYIPKSSSSSELMLGALRLVLAGGVYLPPEVFGRRAVRRSGDSVAATVVTALDAFRTSDPLNPDQFSHSKLTGRQREILLKAVRGLPNKTIASQLCIETGTVKSHLSTAYRALGVRNRTEALYVIAKLGWTA